MHKNDFVSIQSESMWGFTALNNFEGIAFWESRTCVLIMQAWRLAWLLDVQSVADVAIADRAGQEGAWRSRRHLRCAHDSSLRRAGWRRPAHPQAMSRHHRAPTAGPQQLGHQTEGGRSMLFCCTMCGVRCYLLYNVWCWVFGCNGSNYCDKKWTDASYVSMLVFNQVNSSGDIFSLINAITLLLL